MSRLMEEPKQHIHDALVSELNEMSIRIKLGMATIKANNVDRNGPTWEEVLYLIDRCRDEMNQCTKPYKVY
jgi:hypothetical protein